MSELTYCTVRRQSQEMGLFVADKRQKDGIKETALGRNLPFLLFFFKYKEILKLHDFNPKFNLEGKKNNNKK